MSAITIGVMSDLRTIAAPAQGEQDIVRATPSILDSKTVAIFCGEPRYPAAPPYCPRDAVAEYPFGDALDRSQSNPAYHAVRGALRLLDSPEKWCKNTLQQTGPDGQRQYCIRGALYKATAMLGFSVKNGGPQLQKADYLLAKTFGPRVGLYPHVDFQNRPDTTFDQMRALLHKALAI